MEKMLLRVVLFCVWRLVGVFGATSLAPMSVMEGESVTLTFGQYDLEDRDQVKWSYRGASLATINVINDTVTVYDDVLDGRFRYRLKVDNKTGSLTITNITTEDTGNYAVDSTSQTNYPSQINFILTVYKSVSVMEGESVTLDTGVTKIHAKMEWVYETQQMTIAFIVANGIGIFGTFRDKLNLNRQTGSLTIKNITTEQAGLYRFIISGVNPPSKAFNIFVHAHLPVPVIIRDSSQCSSSCSVVCSVVNVSHVTLSWLKGNSLLSSVSVSDLSISLSLPLEVEDQDNNTYSCEINNTITHKTTHLNISRVCQTCEDSVHCCGSTEALIRLVLSALVGVATILIVVYDIKTARRYSHIRTY